MNEELEDFLNKLISNLQATGQDDLRASTLVYCIKSSIREMNEGSEDGPDEGDGPEWD